MPDCNRNMAPASGSRKNKPMKYRFALFILLALFSLRVSAQDGGFRFFSDADREAIRTSAAAPWGRAILDSLAREVERRREHPLEVPLLEGGHLHDYFCPRHNVMLAFDWDRPTAHYCSLCRDYIVGDKRRDWAWVNVLHARNLDYLVCATYLYLATGERKYAEYIRDMLLDYASKYPTYFEHNTDRRATALNSGRMFGQSLDEAVWASDAARAYMVAKPVMTPREVATIEKGYLRVCADMLLKRRGGGNWQVWHNSGLIALGVALGDDSLIDTALNDPECGYRRLMEACVYADGWWNEGSPTYHYYPLRAMLLSAEALRCRGIDLFDGKLFRMFASPAQGTYADLMFPAHNDGWHGESLTAQVRLYELAYAHYRDPLLLNVLKRCYGAVPRNSYEALRNPDGAAFGGEAVLPGSLVFGDLGVGILRSGRRTVVLKYGPYGGGHGHPDKLSVSVHDGQRELLPDLGTSAYGVPVFRGWYRRTLAHNTVTVDGADQRPVTGSLTKFSASSSGGTVAAACSDAYAGVGMERTLTLRGERLKDIFTCSSDSLHTYDYVLLLTQQPRIDGESQAAEFGDVPAYDYISDVRKYDKHGEFALEVPGAKIAIKVGRGAAFEVFTGEAPGIPSSLSAASSAPVCYPVIIRVRGNDLRVETDWIFN